MEVLNCSSCFGSSLRGWQWDYKTFFFFLEVEFAGFLHDSALHFALLSDTSLFYVFPFLVEEGNEWMQCIYSGLLWSSKGVKKGKC